MRIFTAVFASIILSGIQPGSAICQERDAGSDGGLRHTIASERDFPISPSSATTTVSPSSVPQAMERMSGSDTTADVSLGAIYAGGDFGTGSQTSIWSTAVSARVRLDNWRLSASLPWMRIRSRSTIFNGIDATPVLAAPNTSPGKQTAKGFGDITLGAAYTIAPASLPLEIELSGRAKLNTATRSSGLSSGETDYAVGADLSVPLGRVTPFASFTYRFLGDTEAYHLRNGPAASAGLSYEVGANSFLLTSYHYSRAATKLINNAHELFLGASTRVPGAPLRITGFATAGLSNGAADASAGLALSAAFGSKAAR
ncbi:hypothetical protein [Sphingomonas aerophila]|uniref:Transporter n=1 Tax=Sphingomonas aerophila TaxID=1344948 RepID=A0A7W9EW08_9SPHN|nr:hypothetical protein [Sphingomonas aerophila]MBB5716899.1 hypothetical protein [Sphingomonas aerophila]